MAHQGDLKMPPGSKAPAPPQQLNMIKTWIDAGAPWTEGVDKKPETSWWSLRSPVKPAAPQLSEGDQKLARSPFDAFVLAKLRDKGLKPAPPADKLALVRRAYFDLIGLPPTPQQVESFVKASSPNAFSHLVNQLLENPRYGEHWARHWLESAVGAIRIEERFTPQEKAELQKLRHAISAAVIEFPESDGSHLVNYDGFFDVPTATILERVPAELIPPSHLVQQRLGRARRLRAGTTSPAQRRSIGQLRVFSAT